MNTVTGGPCQTLRGLADELRSVEHTLLDAEDRLRARLITADADWRESATNLVHYAALRAEDRRPEITDAAVGGRAECVMLNKGPFVPQAVRTLSDILGRMESHQRKKTSLFRRLRSVGFGEERP